MRYGIYFCLLWVFACLALVSIAESADDAGPVCRWNFDDTLEDAAGSIRDKLTAHGTVRYVHDDELPGVSGGAIALGVLPDDVGYLTADVSEDIRLGANYTVEAWIHPTQLSGWNRLMLRWAGPPDYAYHVALHQGRVSLFHNQANDEYLFAEGGRVATGRWHHLAAVCQSDAADPTKSRLIVYLNGRKVGITPFDGTSKRVESEQLGIGDSAGTPVAGSRFQGYLDDVTLWRRPLSSEEIALHYAERADAIQQQEAELRKLELAKRAHLSKRLQHYACREIVFAERGAGRDPSGHYYANFGYSCIDPDYWIHSSDGGRLVKLHLETGRLTSLVDDPEGAVRDPSVHYDGERILFSYRKGGTHHYHLYEINVDGTGLRQLTDGAWDDVEPTYLPDGGIIFCSTRCKRYIGCWLAQSAVLYRCDANGEEIRQLSSGSFTENTPSVLPDGRVLYTRWEYVNRDPVSFHHLWTMNPDGSGLMVYFGNMHPGGVFIDAKPIPGTGNVVLVNSPGHGRNEHAGHIATLTVKQGPNVRGAMRNISAHGDMRDPWPLADDAILAVRANQIMLLDGAGGSELLYEDTLGTMLHEPCPVRRRPRESRIASQFDPIQPTATMLLTNVYDGRNMKGVKRESIKQLLVMEDLPKPANFHGGGSQPIGHGVTSTLKRILGTVPVESDGSAHFSVPALRSLYFVALDENDLAVKQMRSFVTLQPGETVGCVGCHEHRSQSPSMAGRRDLAALRREASPIRPIEGVPSVMDFPRDVQPILDRHCVRCHQPSKPDGGIVLSGDRGPVFSLAYYELLLHWQVKDTGGDPRDGSGRQPGNDRPYRTYSSASPLIEKLETTHYDVKLTEQERKTVRMWIDAGVQFPGTYAAYGTGQVGGCWGNNRPVRMMADAWPSTPPAAEAVERRCGTCHPARQLPRHVTARIPLDPWGDMLSWTRPLSRYSRHRLFNLSRPEKSLLLLSALSQESGGLARGKLEDMPAGPVAEDRSRPPEVIEHPIVFADTHDPDYRSILTHITTAAETLSRIKRFDMQGFRPNEHYVREMKRYGVLPPSFDLSTDPIDVYATDEAYWRSMWHQPTSVDK